MHLKDSYLPDNIYVPGLPGPDGLFEKRYMGSRGRENRVYSDRETAWLPDISADHPHHQEWMRRKKSCRRLLHYLSGKIQAKELAAKKKKGIPQKAPTLNILDIGCGNGWLSHQFSLLPGTKVVGLDINLTDLKQAARVFRQQPNLKFIYGDFCSDVLNGLSFDIIVFAASIAYFPSLPSILNSALAQLRPGGEIHILDSCFYTPGNLASAQSLSRAYYSSLGFPEMAGHYFHHCLPDRSQFKYRLLYNPYSLWNQLLRPAFPFPWIRVMNGANAGA